MTQSNGSNSCGENFKQLWLSNPQSNGCQSGQINIHIVWITQRWSTDITATATQQEHYFVCCLRSLCIALAGIQCTLLVTLVTLAWSFCVKILGHGWKGLKESVPLCLNFVMNHWSEIYSHNHTSSVNKYCWIKQLVAGKSKIYSRDWGICTVVIQMS